MTKLLAFLHLRSAIIAHIILASIILTYVFIPSMPSVLAAALLDDCSDEGSPVSIRAWPDTDFSLCTVPFDEVLSGGPGKDGIPAIDTPVIIAASDEDTLTSDEPVISLAINGQARAWPLRYLIWHEIVNDTLGGVPISATYCPLCNAAIVFDRRFDGDVLDFGTTGNLRKSDLIMYDRQTETWWQQYTGEGIFGTHAGRELKVLASRLESWQEFATRHPDGTVLRPNNPNLRPYGANPYRGYDTSAFPFLFDGEFPQGIEPMARVVVIDGKAWALSLLREKNIITDGDVTITWRGGQRSALDSQLIEQGRDVGTVIAKSNVDDADIPYDVTFAFVYHAFTPDGTIITK